MAPDFLDRHVAALLAMTILVHGSRAVSSRIWEARNDEFIN